MMRLSHRILAYAWIAGSVLSAIPKLSAQTFTTLPYNSTGYPGGFCLPASATDPNTGAILPVPDVGDGFLFTFSCGPAITGHNPVDVYQALLTVTIPSTLTGSLGYDSGVPILNLSPPIEVSSMTIFNVNNPVTLADSGSSISADSASKGMDSQGNPLPCDFAPPPGTA